MTLDNELVLRLQQDAERPAALIHFLLSERQTALQLGIIETNALLDEHDGLLRELHPPSRMLRNLFVEVSFLTFGDEPAQRVERPRDACLRYFERIEKRFVFGQ